MLRNITDSETSKGNEGNFKQRDDKENKIELKSENKHTKSPSKQITSYSPTKKLLNSNHIEDKLLADFKNEPGERSGVKSMTTKGPSWISSVKRVSTSIANSKLFLKNDQEILFCISVDGSKHSDYAFDMITENFWWPNTKLLCLYVFYSKIDFALNYSNKKATVLEKYATKMERFKKQTHFVTEDKTSKIHALEQAAKLAENYQANFLVCGYQGLKGPRGDNKEQVVGHDYLLASSRTPVMVIKEETNRELKKGKAFKWLIIMDKAYNYPMKAFTTFLPLIEPELDIVDGIGFYPNSRVDGDELKDQFETLIKKNHITNSTYEAIPYGGKKLLYQWAIEKINFGQVIYDFVVLYNNSSRFKSDPDNNDASQIIKGTQTNVFFVNFYN